MKNLTQERLREVLSYDEVTGDFTWLVGRKKGSVAGCLRPDGRIVITVNKIRYRAHHLAWLEVTGSLPETEIDHINWNPSDNRAKNLRLANRQSNVWHAPETPTKRSVSGFRGVFRNTNKYQDGKPWVARIMVQRKQIHLGSFATPEAASAAYLEAKRKYHKV